MNIIPEPKAAPVLTIERVKELIAFPKGSGIHTSLTGIVECTYEIAKQNGKTEPEAAKEALDYLGAKLLEMS